MSKNPKGRRKPKRSKTPPKGSNRRRTFALLGFFVVAVGVGSFAVYRQFFAGSGAASTGAATTVSQETLVLGEEIYRANCAVCHGDQGQGHALPAAPALNGSEHSWHHPDWQIINLLRNGGTQMPAVAAEWGDEDIEAVISYFKQWWSERQQESQSGMIGE